MAVSKHVLIRIPSIDWELMREQKAVLLELSDKHPDLEGVISMYDHIQDEAEAAGCPVLWLEEVTND
jgi:hypothetical protein